MNKKIEALVNALYQEWIKTNDPFEESFEDLLAELLPNYSFGCTKENWYIIKII